LDIFVSEDAGIQKPRIEYFDYVFIRLGNPDKKQMIIIGDSLTSDMKGGENAGIASCWYNPKGLPNPDNVPCTYEIKKLNEVIPIVLG
jgi:2-haloacid dehalogenase